MVNVDFPFENRARCGLAPVANRISEFERNYAFAFSDSTRNK